MKKKIIAAIAIAVALIAITVLSVDLWLVNKEKKAIRAELEATTLVVDSLQGEVDCLQALECIRINVNFTLTQKNIASINMGNYQNIAREVVSITRRELLDSLTLKDSMYAKR